MHLTGGILRHFQAFLYTQAESCSWSFVHARPSQVTQAVGQPRAKSSTLYQTKGVKNMDNIDPENNLQQKKEPAPIDPNWLGQWLQAIQKSQNTQIELLNSIRGMLQFFVVLTILSMILGACSVILSF